MRKEKECILANPIKQIASKKGYATKGLSKLSDKEACELRKLTKKKEYIIKDIFQPTNQVQLKTNKLIYPKSRNLSQKRLII